MYETVYPLSGVAEIDGWCVGEGIPRLFAAATFGILIDADALTVWISHVLTDATPKFAAAALGAIAELHNVRSSWGGLDDDLAELTSL